MGRASDTATGVFLGLSAFTLAMMAGGACLLLTVCCGCLFIFGIAAETGGLVTPVP